MKLIWSKHALRQLGQRTCLEADEVLHYFATEAAVLSREERNGVREYVIFSPLDKECFAIVVARDWQVVTLMPIKWRRIAPGFIDQARTLYLKKIGEIA